MGAQRQGGRGSRARVCIRFSFKGEWHAPCLEIDLDQWMEDCAGDADRLIESLYQALGREIGIDSWSYVWDVMVMEPLEFERVEGLATAFVEGGRLDAEGFARAWQAARIDRELARIAREHLGVTRLEDEPALRDALRAVWQAAVEAGRSQAG